MARTLLSAGVLLFATKTLATYDRYHYTTEASQWMCPGMKNACKAPSICAHDTLTDQYHCCDTGAEDAVCWNNNSPCGGQDSLSPGSNQIGCSSGQNAFCCLAQREQCTQRFNQVNICWETAIDPFRNVSQDKMNQVFSSLSSQSPAAATLTVSDLEIVTGTPTAVASQSSAVPSASESATGSGSGLLASPPAQESVATDVSIPQQSASTSNSAIGEPSSSKGVSAGVIGGAVVGAIACVAIFGGGALFFSRRRSTSKSATATNIDDASTDSYTRNETYRNSVIHEKYASGVAVQAPSEYPVQEMTANHRPVELDGTGALEKMGHFFV